MNPTGISYNPVQAVPFGLRLRLRIALWSVVRATLYRFCPNPLRGVRRELLRVFGADIAPTASPDNKARIDFPWNLTMSNFASVGEHCWIYALDRIVLGEYACVGQHVHLLTATHDYNDPGFPLVTRALEIGCGAWVAERATVLPGCHIGDYTVIGAGAVVTRPMPAGMVCAGNPCVVLKPRRLAQAAGQTAL